MFGLGNRYDDPADATGHPAATVRPAAGEDDRQPDDAAGVPDPCRRGDRCRASICNAGWFGRRHLLM